MRRVVFLAAALALAAAAASAAPPNDPRSVMVLRGARYAISATNFNASAYATKSGTLTGASTTSSGVFSTWFNNPNGTGVFREMISINPGNANNYFQSYIGSTGTVNAQGQNVTPATVMSGTSTAASYVNMGTTWAHLLVSFNLATPRCQMYINDVNAVSSFGTCTVSGVLPYSSATQTMIGAANGGSTLFGSANLADMQFWQTADLDISDAAARRLFIDGIGHAVDPAVAQAALGVPIIRLSGAGSAFVTSNKGSGGNFVVTAGALTAAGSTPP